MSGTRREKWETEPLTVTESFTDETVGLRSNSCCSYSEFIFKKKPNKNFVAFKPLPPNDNDILDSGRIRVGLTMSLNTFWKEIIPPWTLNPRHRSEPSDSLTRLLEVDPGSRGQRVVRRWSWNLQDGRPSHYVTTTR